MPSSTLPHAVAQAEDPPGEGPRWQAGEGQRLRDVLRIEHVLVVALISIGLYGFGMSLNDLIDRRRDRQLAPHRPLPSGRIGVVTAPVVRPGTSSVTSSAG